MSRQQVLLTGGSGFIAKHIMMALLARGFAVRATVRNRARAEAVLAALAKAGVASDGLSFATADLLEDAGWAEAIQGCDAVLHTASPFPVQQPDNPDDVIRPARDGTLRVLRAAHEAGVRRVVLTSSTVAILYGTNMAPEHVYTEADFSDETRTDLTPYIRSKTLAEKAAWQFVRDTSGAPELVVINPGFVHGTALDDDLSTSHELFCLMARGIYPAAPKIRFPVADVEDVAALHAEAVTNTDMAGERYLVADGLLSLFDLGVLLGETCPDLASKAPKFELPDIAVRTLALADKRLRTILPELGQHKDYSNAKVTALLGRPLSPPKDAIRQSIRSLRQLALI